jgi:hypothetical protein
MEEQYYDDASIAARSKREQLMKEAEEYRLRRHIDTLQNLDKSEKKLGVVSHRKYGILHSFRPRLTS